MEKFNRAVPVWAADKSKKMHIRLQFKGVFQAKRDETWELCLASSGIYHVYVNGSFLAYGPARTGKGNFVVDRLSLGGLLQDGRNTVIIEVCGYYATSFYVQKQPSFLIAELSRDGESKLWTGEHFTARVNPEYIRKTQRFSFQRPMLEAYKVIASDNYFVDETAGMEPLEETGAGHYLKRKTPYPQYERLEAVEISSGTVGKTKPDSYWRDRSLVQIGELLSGFPLDELETIVTDECQEMTFTEGKSLRCGVLPADSYSIYQFPHNATGMVTLEVACEQPVSLYVLFDEVLVDGTIECPRNSCANVVKYELEKGIHKLQFFEVYTMMYLQFVALGGACRITKVGMVEYKHPMVSYDTSCYPPALRKIADAAIETYRQNSVDLFTDCPSRERAGWLCDSFFMGRTEQCLTGDNRIERCFLESLLCEEQYEGLPEGMVPMCYPADHLNGGFIPNWALWFILELEDYVKRTQDTGLSLQFQKKVEKLLDYFASFENEHGLLEKLDGGLYVDWSKANELVQDVNYPTNMLYHAALKAAGNLFGREELLVKAERVRDTVLAESFNGTFFCDNAVRKDGKLTLTGECTEACQYYAFFCGVATKETHGELYETLVREFGPDRDEKKVWPEIYPADAFIGNHLRLDILVQYGEYERAYENIIAYFSHMAEQTGTLWEHLDAGSSCNHGFTSYVVCWLEKIKQSTGGENNAIC